MGILQELRMNHLTFCFVVYLAAPSCFGIPLKAELAERFLGLESKHPFLEDLITNFQQTQPTARRVLYLGGPIPVDRNDEKAQAEIGSRVAKHPTYYECLFTTLTAEDAVIGWFSEYSIE